MARGATVAILELPRMTRGISLEILSAIQYKTPYFSICVAPSGLAGPGVEILAGPRDRPCRINAVGENALSF
jgi:hypothetical protein